jgi:pimeloyl-ACP methyl ester carboxylesterase
MVLASCEASGVAAFRAEQFSVRVDDEVLADLRARIRNTRWPGPAPGALWEQGTDLGYLQGLLGYWADGFDWRAQERWLNGFRHFRAGIDGVRVHFVHERARGGRGIPLILTNGWPSCFAEFLPLVPRLTDPAVHGMDGPGFDVVIPSLPGYGFSDRPARTGVTCRYTAGLWHRLMRGLGYQRYGAHGGDFGAAVTTFMALDDPAPMLGIHLSNLDLAPYTGPGARPLSAAEQAYLAQYQRWREDDRGYGAIQSTRPQTLSYGLTPQILGLISPHASTMTKIALQLAIFVVAAVPGYVLAIARLDRIGHRRLQLTGFAVMALCFAVIAAVPGMTTMVVPFLLVYGVSYFFTEFGPNMTTFVLPSELFPVSMRTTGHGISAGIGKLGAFIGVFLFPVLQTSLGLRGTLLLTAGVSVSGFALTFVLPEPAGRSLEDIAIGTPARADTGARPLLIADQPSAP